VGLSISVLISEIGPASKVFAHCDSSVSSSTDIKGSKRKEDVSVKDLKDKVMKLVLWDSPGLWLWMLNLRSAIHKWEFDMKLQKFLELPCVFQLVLCLLKGPP